MIIGTQAFVLAAIFYAYKKYARKGIKVPDGTSDTEKSFMYQLLYNQYYIPYFYEEYLVKPYRELSAIFWKKVDLKVVDATVDGIAKVLYSTGESTREMQNGNLSTMLRWMVFGLITMLIVAVIVGLAMQSSGTALPGLGVK
jgi:NADH-quinone oxidoreductase subunit L